MRRLFVILATLSVLPLAAQNEDDARQFQKLAQVFRYLSGLYVDEVEMKPVVEGAITGMLEELDPHSAYIGAEEMKGVQESFDGEFSGIGVEFNVLRDTVIVVNTIAGGPAERVGVRANDRIVRIDTLDAVGMSRTDVPKHLRGKTGTKVGIDVVRHGTPGRLHFVIVRDKIPLNTVDASYLAGEGIGYIKVNRFGRTTMDEFTEAYRKLGRPEGLILDLRGNGGGILQEAVKILSMFVPKGTEVVSMHGRTKSSDATFVTQAEPLDTQIPIAVLVNSMTASAAEIVSGALQDLDRAVLVGQRTFGKGLVQTPRPLGYNAFLKVTTAKYYIPSGRCIQAIDYTHRNDDGSVGLVPDSLIREYETAAGRKVYDGGGIMPDVRLDPVYTSRFTMALYGKGYIEDFANDYYKRHREGVDADTFELPDGEYGLFVAFMQDKEMDFESETQEAVKDLRKKAEREKYLDRISGELDAIGEKLKDDKNTDLELFGDEIRKLIGDEIILRYHYETGVARHTALHDPEVRQAVEVLKDQNRYRQIVTSQDTPRK